MSTNILLIDSSIWKNKGGGGIVLGMVNVLQDLFEEPEITVHCNEPELCDQHLNWDVNFKKCYPVYPEKIAELTTVVKESGILLGETILNRISFLKYTDNFADYVDADIVLGAGGGYIGGYNRGTPISLFRLWFASQLGKPVILGPNTVEPFGYDWLQKVSIPLLKSVDHIMSREQYTTDYLDSLSFGNRTSSVPDAAFMMYNDSSIDGQEILNNESSESGPYAGVTVRDWHFNRTENPDKRRQEYLESVADTIDYLNEEYGYHVLIAQQVHRDLELSYTVSGMAETDDVSVMEGHYTPTEMVSTYSELKLLVGTRLHSVLMAFVGGTPAVDISYGVKGHGIMSSLGLDEYVIDISDITFSQLSAMVDDVVINLSRMEKEIENKLSKKRQTTKSEWGRILNVHVDNH